MYVCVCLSVCVGRDGGFHKYFGLASPVVAFACSLQQLFGTAAVHYSSCSIRQLFIMASS